MQMFESPKLVVEFTPHRIDCASKNLFYIVCLLVNCDIRINISCCPPGIDFSALTDMEKCCCCDVSSFDCDIWWRPLVVNKTPGETGCQLYVRKLTGGKKSHPASWWVRHQLSWRLSVRSRDSVSQIQTPQDYWISSDTGLYLKTSNSLLDQLRHVEWQKIKSRREISWELKIGFLLFRTWSFF